MEKIPQLDTINRTWKRLNDEGYRVSQSAIRHWVKSGAIPSVASGNKRLVYYPNILAFLQKGEPPQSA